MSPLILEVDKEDNDSILRKSLKLREIKELAQGHMKSQFPSKLKAWSSAAYLVISARIDSEYLISSRTQQSS